LDPAADNTDVYFFVGYDETNLGRDAGEKRVVMIMNVNPGQEPGDGPIGGKPLQGIVTFLSM